jgi:lipoyl(octanoyl) transferase
MTEVIIVDRGVESYQQTHQAMKDQIAVLKGGVRAELWCVQHSPVFTQGQAGKAEHVLNPGDIPIVQSDRGGQVTYHGPGQVILYTLVPMRHFSLNVRDLVSLLEDTVIKVLASYGVSSGTFRRAWRLRRRSEDSEFGSQNSTWGFLPRRGVECVHGS